MPAYIIGDETTDDGTKGGAQTEHRSHDALHLAPLDRRVKVCDGCCGHRYEDTPASALHRPANDEHLHAVGQSCGYGTAKEKSHAQQEEGLPAVEVGQLAAYGYSDGLAKHVGCEHPAVKAETSQVRGDDGAAGGHDSSVQACGQHSQHQTHHDEAAMLRVDV